MQKETKQRWNHCGRRPSSTEIIAERDQTTGIIAERDKTSLKSLQQSVFVSTVLNYLSITP
jgi:hypothetical protein